MFYFKISGNFLRFNIIFHFLFSRSIQFQCICIFIFNSGFVSLSQRVCVCYIYLFSFVSFFFSVLSKNYCWLYLCVLNWPQQKFCGLGWNSYLFTSFSRVIFYLLAYEKQFANNTNCAFYSIFIIFYFFVLFFARELHIHKLLLFLLNIFRFFTLVLSQNWFEHENNPLFRYLFVYFNI